MQMHPLYSAITTKFLGPTNHRRQRVKAVAAAGAAAGAVTVDWEFGKTVECNHAMAAEALANKYGWTGEWYGGGLRNGDYVFVCHDRQNTPLFITNGHTPLPVK